MQGGSNTPAPVAASSAQLPVEAPGEPARKHLGQRRDPDNLLRQRKHSSNPVIASGNKHW